VVKVVTFLDFNKASWRGELGTAVEDYLRRSREEITLEEEWYLLNLAMLGKGDVLLIVALDEAEQHVQGFCVLRAMQGTQATGNIVNVWQSYVWPGRAKLADLFTDTYPLMLDFARQYGAKRFTMQTRRMSEGYRRVLERLGFTPYMLTYTKGVGEDGSLRGWGDQRARPGGEEGDVLQEGGPVEGGGDGGRKPV